MKHYTIPVFVPELACPFQCVFCDQEKITGKENIPAPEDVMLTIEKYLKTFPAADRHVEVGFFGGNFTGIPSDDQRAYLEVAYGYLKRSMIDGIRLSTRPDYINDEVLKLLKDHGVTTVELGAQSMDEKVLEQSGRGHTVADTLNAAEMIKEAGIRLGLQMMLGLPGDTPAKSKKTARMIVKAGAVETRIYPTLVIKGTGLENLYKEGKYKPLSMNEAVAWSMEVVKIFESGNVKVIRVGLHPSEGIISGDELVAGPFHTSFRELVMTGLWWEKLRKIRKERGAENIRIYVPPGQLNYAVGYEAKNRKRLLKKYKSVVFHADNQLSGRNYEVVVH